MYMGLIFRLSSPCIDSYCLYTLTYRESKATRTIIVSYQFLHHVVYKPPLFQIVGTTERYKTDGSISSGCSATL